MRSGMFMVGLCLLAACGAPQTDAPAGLGDACVDIGLDQGCSVVAAGLLNDGPGDERLHWQIQDGASAEDGVGGGLAIFAETEDGQLEQLITDTTAWRYEAPVFIRDGDSNPPLLVVHGTSRGTSASPINLAWQWGEAGWRRIDLGAWHGEAETILGEASIQNGFRIDFENMLGVTPLWRSVDGRCCPSGGWARIDFELRERVLHVTSASAYPTEAAPR